MAMLLACVGGIALAQETGASVAGRVTNSVTGAPIVRAHVRSMQLVENGHTYGALTDDKGKFSFAQLPAGKYSMTAEAAGFETPQFIFGESTDQVELRAGENRADFDIALTAYGVISGRVLDAEGRPVQGVSVAALGLDGFVSYQISDPRGEYRMDRLSPGRYRVRAAPEAVHMPPEIRSDGTTEMRYASTYYPDSLTVESAAPLDVQPGGERTGADIRLVRAPIVAVRGTVLGSKAGDSANVDIRKVEPPRGPNTGRGSFGYGNRVNPDGSFVVWGLDPGSYHFVATSDGSRESAAVEVTIAGKDVNGVLLGMVRKLDVSGNIVAADESARLPTVPADASLGEQKQISMDGVSGEGSAYSVVANDGTFHLSNVSPGRYSVRLTWGPYVQSMRLGSTDIDGAILDLRTAPEGAALTVNTSSATGEISGTVRNAVGPVAHARVALVEEGVRGWPWITAAHGDYTFSNVRPGKYQLLVLDTESVNAFALRFQLFDYADVIETVDLGAGERVTRDLRQHDRK